MILGAPSLPKSTPRRASAESDQASSSSAVLQRTRFAVDPRKHPRMADSPPPPSARPAPGARSLRQAPVPVAVPGRNSPTPAVPGRSPVSVHRIVEAAVRLHPEKCTCIRMALGDLTIELSLRGGVLEGVVEAPSRAARDAVAAQLDQFRAALERKGIAVGELRVVVSGESSELVSVPCSARVHLIDLWA
jgi:hypothetical protein